MASLVSQRFRASLNFGPIELHATFVGEWASLLVGPSALARGVQFVARGARRVVCVVWWAIRGLDPWPRRAGAKRSACAQNVMH